MTNPKPASPGVSLASLNLVAAADVPYQMPFLNALGDPTGVVIEVLGAQSEKVTSAVNAAVNGRRKAEIAAKAAAARRNGEASEFTPVEDDILFGQRLAAARIVGWHGITEAFTPELALTLCQTNPELARQVIEASNDLANFTKVSPLA